MNQHMQIITVNDDVNNTDYREYRANTPEEFLFNYYRARLYRTPTVHYRRALKEDFS
ncbi:hypothetical protein ccbrp13_20900 [Ktedonobacteria bacterium brp13]|nr:hypothetical protein ccbrp13_20900 [Ktedonobacteria bacterium brp13]